MIGVTAYTAEDVSVTESFSGGSTRAKEGTINWLGGDAGRMNDLEVVRPCRGGDRNRRAGADGARESRDAATNPS